MFLDSKESFERFHSTSTQIDRVWSTDNPKIPPRETMKNPPKVMVWAIMSNRAVSEMHFVPAKQIVNVQYYVEDIMEKSHQHALSRTSENGDILTRKFLPNMSRAIFMQDNAPAHTANITQTWCSKYIPAFLAKSEWRGNSRNLNPIENLWSKLHERLNELKSPTNQNQLSE